MTFATLDPARVKGGTTIAWCWWPGTKGETLTTIRGCKWAKYFDATTKRWVYFETCAGCYAQNTAHSLCTRFDSPHYAGLTKATERGPIWTGKVRFDEEQLLSVLKMTASRTFFLTSMGDLFYEDVPDEIVAYHFAVMAMANWHRFLVLTKRPDRMAVLVNSAFFWSEVNRKMHGLWTFSTKVRLPNIPTRQLKFRSPDNLASNAIADAPGNIWFGTSIENEPSANWALNELVKVPAPGRLWVSFEPMLEYVDLSPWLDRLSWVVLGGASKQAKAHAPLGRLAHFTWVIGDCARAHVPVFLKQLGARFCRGDGGYPHDFVHLPKHDNHNADPRYWPQDLRVQQFPVPA